MINASKSNSIKEMLLLLAAVNLSERRLNLIFHFYRVAKKRPIMFQDLITALVIDIDIFA